MLRNVAALVHDGAGTFGIGVASEVFGYDRSQWGLPAYDFALCARTAGRIRTDTGLDVLVEHDLSRLAVADAVFVMSWNDVEGSPEAEVLDALRAAHARGATIVSHCTGAFVLAAAGLLDGRRATTHWYWADTFARRFPAVQLDRDVLYVDEGSVLTGAGTAAGIDLCLYLLRREHGPLVANTVAKRMIVPPFRDGGQAQYVTALIPHPTGDGDRISAVLGWLGEHLHEDVTVDDLAARALMSPRSFARHFRAATGTTPHAWLLAQRLARAEELLEGGDLPVDEVARRVGFGTAATLRHHFARRRGVSPVAYRRAFRGALAG